jgi:hypothetical protein
MTELGNFVRAKDLLRRAARDFGPREAVARAKCVVAEAEIAVVSRDLGWPARNSLVPMDMLKPGFTLLPVPDQLCVEMAATSRRRHRAAITGQIFRWLLQILR